MTAHIGRFDHLMFALLISAVGGIAGIVLHVLRLIWPGRRP